MTWMCTNIALLLWRRFVILNFPPLYSSIMQNLIHTLILTHPNPLVHDSNKNKLESKQIRKHSWKDFFKFPIFSQVKLGPCMPCIQIWMRTILECMLINMTMDLGSWEDFKKHIFQYKILISYCGPLYLTSWFKQIKSAPPQDDCILITTLLFLRRFSHFLPLFFHVTLWIHIVAQSYILKALTWTNLNLHNRACILTWLILEIRFSPMHSYVTETPKAMICRN